MGKLGCPRCGSAVALHDGRPFVTATGCVELWHRACFDVRGQPLPVVEPLEPPPVRYRRASTIATLDRTRVAIGAVAGLALVSVFVGWATAGTSSAASLVNIDVVAHEHEMLGMHSTSATHDVAPPRVTRGGEEFAIPTINSEPLDRIYPSLRGWIHPVAASSEKVPKRNSRRFGSHRAGIERHECGSGHCGIDLDGPRGRPIVAVAAGIVVRVERSASGADGKSGRYVRLVHDDGTLTAYMHLDDVADSLHVGDRIDPGQYLGTLGATGVFSAPPHLHFALEIPDRAGLRGDHAATEYVDPAPFLARARIAPVPDMRSPKPLN